MKTGMKIGGLGCFTLAAIYGCLWFIAAKLFEYSLWTIIGKDVPWYADMLGRSGAQRVELTDCDHLFDRNLAGAPQPWVTF
jgi:hypothetical protein